MRVDTTPSPQYEGVTPDEQILHNGEWFFSPGDDATWNISAKSGDTLEYLLVQTAGNVAPLTGVKFRTNIPDFTKYEPDSTTLNGDNVEDVLTSSNQARSWFSVAGGMPVNSPGSEEGTIEKNASATMTYKVKVDEFFSQGWDNPAVSEHTLWVAGTTDKDVCWETDITLADTDDSTMCNEYGCWVEGTGVGSYATGPTTALQKQQQEYWLDQLRDHVNQGQLFIGPSFSAADYAIAQCID